MSDRSRGTGVPEDLASCLMTCAHRHPRRVDFLPAIGSILMERTDASALGIWLQHQRLRTRWCSWGGAASAAHAGVSVFPAEPNALIEAAVASLCVEGMLDDDADAAVDTVHGAVLLDRRGLGRWTLIPFGVEQERPSLLVVRRPAEPLSTSTWRQIAAQVGIAEASREARAALVERVKELSCMYDLAHLAQRSDLSLEASLSTVANRLPSAWQYPEIASARLTVDGVAYLSDGFREGSQRLAADLATGERCFGRVEVFYDTGPDAHLDVHLNGTDPFLEEERRLIEAVAREVASSIERRGVEADRARLQAQVLHADRLATIGQLAAGVAHELNEPLANILGFAQLAAKAEGLSPQVRSDLGRITSSSLYAREIIKQLMLFARRDAGRPVVVDLDRVIDDGLGFLERRWLRAGVQLERVLSELPGLVHADPGQLRQVLVNLVVNAVQAMPGGGRLSVETRVTDEAVLLAVEDTGVGIPAELLDRVFLPFFTTKDVGEGTGLGLSVAHGIVASLGGTIAARSEVGSGTCFEVRLPRAEPSSSGDEPDG